MHGPTKPLQIENGLKFYKFGIALVTCSLLVLILAAPFFKLDLSVLILCISANCAIFMSLRVVNMVRLGRRVRQMVKRYGIDYETAAVPELAWRHLIVIPIYRESVEVIGRTIGNLARHRAAASNYVILCAHEKADALHEEKFRRMHAEFAHRFAGFETTVHTVVAGECPGKAPNINWAARRYAASQPPESWSTTMVTVIDSDTLIDERYLIELEREIAQVADPHAVVMAAPSFFESNRYEIPCFVRAMDDLWSMGAAANIFSNTKLGFPISNYSLSLRMLDDIDYFDVDHDSTGEDFHIFVKASVKLEKDVRLVPIAAAMNNEDVEGHDYRSSLLARYAQSMRHALGVSSTSYLLRGVLSARPSLRKWWLLVLCFEAHTFPHLYFASGLYVLLSFLMGDFSTYFHGPKLILFFVLAGISALAGNSCFLAYKINQFYIRHQVFKKPLNLRREVYADACDLGVQGLCGLCYFLVPFGCRMVQNLWFWQTKKFYSKFEEAARKHR